MFPRAVQQPGSGEPRGHRGDQRPDLQCPRPALARRAGPRQGAARDRPRAAPAAPRGPPARRGADPGGLPRRGRRPGPGERLPLLGPGPGRGERTPSTARRPGARDLLRGEGLGKFTRRRAARAQRRADPRGPDAPPTTTAPASTAWPTRAPCWCAWRRTGLPTADRRRQHPHELAQGLEARRARGRCRPTTARRASSPPS